ncbi:putative Ig domain-containing protein [Pyruvatibacter sp.]|uniref:beta strand repeat-containing protein n=1 Tax=Pyruvatibacter sp. TaxID=1981328 RepID=UPI003264C950
MSQNNNPVATNDGGGSPVVSVSLGSLSGSAGIKITGAPAGADAGTITSLGDVNGDGHADILIGGYKVNAGGNGNSGRAYVVFGSAIGFDTNINLSTVGSTTAGFTIDGLAQWDLLGSMISGAGDLNNDGVNDILLSSHYADVNGTDSGSTYVIYGKDAGQGSTFGATFDLNSLDGTNGFAVHGEQTPINGHGDAFGSGISSAGDVNGDGIDDFMVSAQGADPYAQGGGPGRIRAGTTYVIFGTDTPLSTGTFDLTSLDGTNGFAVHGANADDSIANDGNGRNVSSAGDFNGDGIDDLLIGTPGHDSGGIDDNGGAFIVYGKNTSQQGVSFSTDFDLANLTSSTGVRITGFATAYLQAGFSVSGAGDINGDGFDDVIIGSRHVDADGGAFVVFGGQSVANLSATDLDGTNGFRLSGEANLSTGISVRRAGDFNGDGYDDILIGTFSAKSNGLTGSAYVLFGKSDGFSADINLTQLDGTDGFRLNGTHGGDATGRLVSDAGDLNNDGLDDILVGALTANTGGLGSTGAAYVVYGRNYRATEDAAVTIGNVLANDTDGDSDALTVTLVDAVSANGAAVSIHSSNGSFNYDPTGAAVIQALAAGQTLTDTFTYTVSDGNGGTDTATVTVTVVGVEGSNNPPVVVGSVAAQTTAEDAPFSFTLAGGLFNDPDVGDTLTLSATQADGSPLPTWLSFDALTETFSGTPENGDVGVISVKVIASDGTASTDVTFDVTVTNTNDAPVATSGVVAQTTAEDAPFSFALPAGLFTDPDVGDTLTLSATQADGSALPTWLSFDALTETFSGTPENGDVGVISVKVIASDGTASTDVTFDVTVTNTNDAPVATAGVVAQSTAEDAPFSFALPAGLFTDPDVGDTLTLSATQADGSALPTWLSFDALTETFSGTPENGDVGVVSVKVIASDGTASTDVTFDVTVTNTNDAPVATAGVVAQTTAEDAPFSFALPAGLFTDPDVGDTLTLSATQADGSALPTWLAFDALTETFSGTPENGDVGVISVKVIASDGTASTDVTFDVTVTNTNDAPVATAGVVAQTTAEDAPFSFALPAGLFTDPDIGDTLTLSATQADGSALPTWLSFDALTETFSGTPENGDVGVVSVKVIASDGTASTDVTFDVSVTNTNDAPTVSVGLVGQSAEDGQGFLFAVPAGTFADVDVGDQLVLSATLLGGAALPAWLAFDAATGTFSGTPANGDVGLLSVSVIATDSAGATATSSFDLTINPPSGDDLLDGVILHGVIDGGPGNDTITYATASGAVAVNLATGVGTGAEATGDSYLNIENAVGSAHSDTLTGDAGNNTLQGNAGADVIDGGAGTDAASYSDSAVGVTVNLATGINTGGSAEGDQLTAVENLVGSAHADTLTGDAGDNVMWGNAGDDSFFGGAGADTIYGGDGSDSVRGGAGADVLDGGAGGDVVWYDASTTGVTVDLSLTTAQISLGDADGDILSGFENLAGSSHADTLTGDAGANVIVGGAGNDVINGGAGNDSLYGGIGADTINGGDGLDVAVYSDSSVAVTIDLINGVGYGGTAEGDTYSSIEGVVGSDYNDNLISSIAAESLNGGGGSDQANYVSSNAAVTVDLSSGGVGQGGHATGDTYVSIERVFGSVYGDVLTGNADANILMGWDGNDTLQGNAGADVIDGGAGTDAASYSDSAVGVTVNLATGINTGGSAEGDQLTAIENLVGSAHADTLTGDAGDNVMWGNAGDDSFFGGAGADTIYGGDGSDSVRGGAGADVLDGGAGGDIVWYDGSTVGVTVDLSLTTAQISLGDADGDILSGFENLAGSSYADTLTGDAGANVIVGGDGNDVLYGNNGDDTLYGGDGNDNLFGQAGADVIDGGAGTDVASYASSWAGVTVNLTTGINTGGTAEGDQLTSIENLSGSIHDDVLTGDAGANTLWGWAGNDTLNGGAGADTLDGGDGSDTVSYAGSNVGIVVNLDTGGTFYGDADGDTLVSIENLEGSAHADQLFGTSAVNTLSGGAGGDLLGGGLGADVLDGGEGSDWAWYSNALAGVTVNLATNVHSGADAAGDNLISIENVYGTFHIDTLIGDAGDNVLDGRAGADVLDGGAGIDTAQYIHSTGGVTVDLLAGTGTGSVAEGDTLTNIENITGSSHADTLSGDHSVNTLWGNAGDDVLYGNNGDDTLYGGDGNDNLFGQAGADVIDGGAGTDVASYASSWAGVTVNLATDVNTGGTAEGDQLTSIENLSGSIHDDVLTGDAGANTLWGWAGNDTLKGGAGSDTLYGGDGTDTAIYDGVLADYTISAGSGGVWTVTHISTGDVDTLTGIETASFSDQTADLSNSPPVAVADTQVANSFGAGAIMSPATLLANDSDPDGDTLTIHSVSNPTGIVQSVSFGYTPGTTDPFSVNAVVPTGLANGVYYGTYDYTVTDGNGGFSTTTVNYEYTVATLTKPIILDMDGDGIELVNADDADIFFDLNGDGETERTGWAAADDGLLVFDKDMDGAATDIDEISFVGYKEGARTDLEGLRAFDTNGDGLLDAGDAQFGAFKVWRDQNQNGVSEAGELQSLTAAGISAIELKSDETVRVVGDNVSFGLGSFHKSDGTTGTLSDTAFGSEGLSIDSGSLDALEVAAGEAGFADAGDGAVVHQLRSGLDDILASGGADGLLDKPVLNADRPVILDNAVAGLVSAMAAFDAKSAGQSSLANRADDTSPTAQLAAWVS